MEESSSSSSFSKTRDHTTETQQQRQQQQQQHQQQQQQHMMMANIISSVMQAITKYTTHLSKHFINDRKIIMKLDKLVKYFGHLCIRDFNFFARNGNGNNGNKGKGKEQTQIQVVALAIVLTAIDLMKYTEIPKEHRQRILDDLYRIGGIGIDCVAADADADHQEVLRCRNQLRQIFQRRRQNFFRQALLKKKVSSNKNKPSSI